MGKKTDTLKKAAAPAAKPAVATAPVRKAVKKTAVRKKPAAATAVRTAAAPVITADEISLRAYFIAEKRQQLGLPGDSQSDWLEAERQLRTEPKQPRANAGAVSAA